MTHFSIPDNGAVQYRPDPTFTGDQYTVFYPNGYGASVVRTEYSYGGREGRWELAVITLSEPHDDPRAFELVYDTPVTSDVLGWLTEEHVTKHLAEIAAL